MKNPSIQNDRILDFLNGEVKTSTIWKYSINDGIEILKEHRIREYNKSGSRTKTINFNKNGEKELEQISEFDSNGFKIGYKNFDEFNEFDSKGSYDINSKGNIIAKYFNDRVEETFKFDSSGRLIEQMYCYSRDISVYEYDIDGKYTIEQTNYQNGSKSHLLKYKNDQFGNVHSIETFRFPSFELIHTQVSIYNDFGDEIESYVLVGDNEKLNWYKNEYQYDKKGNWINKIVTTVGNNNKQIVKRSIEYHN